MTYLKKVHSVILFMLAFMMTFQTINTVRIVRLVEMAKEFEPVVIEQVRVVEVVKSEPEIAEEPEAEVEPETILDPEPEVTMDPEPDPEPLGEFRITAYCACEKCCGQWALNRPNGIVYGAAGVELEAGVSCASPLPFGTVVEVEGLGEYIVQDRTAQWVVDKYGENLIDIYFDDHEAACKFGLQYHNVYLKGRVKNDQV